MSAIPRDGQAGTPEAPSTQGALSAEITPRIWKGVELPHGLTPEMADRAEQLVIDFENNDQFSFELVVEMFKLFSQGKQR